MADARPLIGLARPSLPPACGCVRAPRCHRLVGHAGSRVDGFDSRRDRVTRAWTLGESAAGRAAIDITSLRSRQAARRPRSSPSRPPRVIIVAMSAPSRATRRQPAAPSQRPGPLPRRVGLRANANTSCAGRCRYRPLRSTARRLRCVGTLVRAWMRSPRLASLYRCLTGQTGYGRVQAPTRKTGKLAASGWASVHCGHGGGSEMVSSRKPARCKELM